MTVATYRPVHLFNARSSRIAQRDIAQLFDSAEKSQSWQPAVDIHEYDDRFELRADIPGTALNELEITIEKNVLTVTGERPAPEAEEGQAHRIERNFGKFSRQFRLPESVDMEGVKASGDNGVLLIVVPKAEKPQPRKVHVQTA